MRRLALPALLCLLALPAAGQTVDVPPIRPAECQYLEGPVSRTIAALASQTRGLAPLRSSMAGLSPRMKDNDGLRGATDRLVERIDQMEAASNLYREALEDLQHQLRLCGRD